MFGTEAHSVYQALRATAQALPEADFIAVEAATAAAYGIAAEVLRYGPALQRIDALRAAYSSAGFGGGDRVGLLLQNRPEFFLHWLALNALGTSVVPLSSELRTADLGYLIAHSEMTMAVALPNYVPLVHEAARAAGVELQVVEPQRLATLAPRARDTGTPSPDRSTECALLYTSGTTGKPKGCVLSNDYFLRAGRWYNEIGGLCSLRFARERLITPLPLTHMNAMAYSTMAMIMSGGCIVQLDRFHPRSWWQSVQDSRASIVHYLGVMPAMLLKAAARPGEREHQVRFAFGAGVARGDHAAFEARFGFPLLEAWAMTETGAGAVIIANREPRHVGTHCFGRAEAGLECRVVDERGDEAAADQPGELQVRAAGADPRDGFFCGYLKDEAATEAAWQGGYFHTGDVVRRDAAGYFYFVDRKKNVIRRSGENISAVEVEAVLAQHPRVAAVAVTATPDPLRGDEVLACIVCGESLPDAERASFAQEIVRYALTQLAYYKVPGYVAFVDALPLTASQKIQRAELRGLGDRVRETPSCFDMRGIKQRQG